MRQVVLAHERVLAEHETEIGVVLVDFPARCAALERRLEIRCRPPAELAPARVLGLARDLLEIAVVVGAVVPARDRYRIEQAEVAAQVQPAAFERIRNIRFRVARRERIGDDALPDLHRRAVVAFVIAIGQAQVQLAVRPRRQRETVVRRVDLAVDRDWQDQRRRNRRVDRRQQHGVVLFALSRGKRERENRVPCLHPERAG